MARRVWVNRKVKWRSLCPFFLRESKVEDNPEYITFEEIVWFQR
jgi:hypothetical protein